MGEKLKIVLVDDEHHILTSLGMALEAEGYAVRSFSGAQSALESLTAESANLGIFDIKLGTNVDGMDLLRLVRQQSDMPVIFLTSKDREIDELFGFKMGADDYISKPFSQRLVLERVKTLLRRFYPNEVKTAEDDAKLLERGRLQLDLDKHACRWGGRAITLTVTEFLILKALACRPGVVKTRDALMDAAYDDQVYVDDRAIDSHINRIRTKFKQVDEGFDAIDTLFGIGYRLKCSDS